MPPGILWTPTDQWAAAATAFNSVLAEEVEAFNLRHASMKSKSIGMGSTKSRLKVAGVMVHAALQPFMIHVPVTDGTVEHFDCTYTARHGMYFVTAVHCRLWV